MWQGDIKLQWNRPVDEVTMWFFNVDKDYICILPIAKGYHRIWLVYDANILPAQNPTAEELEQVLQKFTGDLTAEVTEPKWLSYQQAFSTGVVNQMQNGNIFLGGDASHLSIPIGGQGMNTGIQDAFNLGWKLASEIRGYTKPVVINSYAIERQKVRKELMTDQIQGFKDTMYPSAFRMFMMKDIAPMMMNVTGSIKGLIEGLRRDESMLDIAFSNSPLNKVIDHCSKLKVGERVPDTAIVLKSKSGNINTTLFSLIYPSVSDNQKTNVLPHWTMLLFEGKESNEAKRKAISEIKKLVTAKYNLIKAYSVLHTPTNDLSEEIIDTDKILFNNCKIKKDTIFFIRPDGHLAYLSRTDKLKEIENYCSRLFN